MTLLYRGQGQTYLQVIPAEELEANVSSLVITENPAIHVQQKKTERNHIVQKNMAGHSANCTIQSIPHESCVDQPSEEKEVIKSLQRRILFQQAY